jgi:hypothetical protein
VTREIAGSRRSLSAMCDCAQNSASAQKPDIPAQE